MTLKQWTTSPVAALAALLAPALMAGTALAQSPRRPELPGARFVVDDVTRVADPKLTGGGVQLAFHVEPAAASVSTVVDVRRGSTVLATLWSGVVSGGDAPTVVAWDGKDTGGVWCDTGSFTLRIAGHGAQPLQVPLDIVRLGITEIEAQDSGAGDDEWQMVYFMRGAAYEFFATPAIHEYINVGHDLEVSDLDLDSGDPRPVAAVHDQTDSPALSGPSYEAYKYNYPLAYIMGSSPRLELVFGDSATSALGGPMGVGYPLPGREIRAVATQGGVPAYLGPIAPGTPTVVDLPPLPGEVGRHDLDVVFRWQQRLEGDPDWTDVPGSTTIPLRVYTLLGEPNFRSGVSGTQYAGPWVEVAEYISSWKETLGFTAGDEVSLTEVHVHGFFGQNGGIPSAIEGVIYDAYPLGGDGGATHYFNFGSWRMNLARLLNGHASGIYVNCSDNMGATTTMLAMMGVDGMRPVRLGGMSLKAIWGIGAPDYTTSLWGGSHGFSYHHIVTNDDAVTVSDTCMQLDEDGDPGSTPGIPGWNHHRLWDGPGGYDDLSSYNHTSRTLEDLPGVQ